MFVKLKAILLLTFFTAFSLSESASFANLIQKFITLTKRYLNRGHGVEKFELEFDPTENTLPSHAKATTHGKRAPG